MHFTYKKPERDLQQGDVLARTPEIDALLEEVHPHYYRHPEYRHLIVLTQSCDLVRRPDCKARYISLAAVRPLETLLTRELEKYQRSERERYARYCSRDAREFVVKFVERLFNNNEPGYFYLHPDSESGIHEQVVAFLTLSIAVKADLHYKTCIGARTGQLKAEFQSKLGWLVGNLYSRVGTDDWVPGTLPETDFDRMVNQEVDRLCQWVDEKFMEKISREERKRKAANPGYRMDEADVAAYVDQLAAQRENKKNELAKQAVAVLRQLAEEGRPLEGEALLSEGDIDKFEKRLLYDRNFAALAK